MKSKLTIGGLLVTLGVVYGDIGTSPLYVMNALMHPFQGESVDPAYVLGCLSLIFWTITILTTFKYICLVLRADNHGEGGIFALYYLVRRRKKWIIVPAIIGGAALLADSILTPAMTVTSAVEGLQYIPGINQALFENTTFVLCIVTIIISGIFFMQKFGTTVIGKLFGPIMVVWFGFLALMGIYNIIGNVEILKALNPYYAINLLITYAPQAMFILGSVFLATTGAEALYSDLGHVGRKNIYATWPVVKICLLLNYFGQGAYVLSQPTLEGNPFFLSMPENLVVFGVLISTCAAIIASQALISGTYTLVSEAITLNLLPKLAIRYPADEKGQMYIPTVNTILYVACLSIVFYFKTSSSMEAAYGLAITITMLMTSILLCQYLLLIKVKKYFVYPIIFCIMSIEFTFFGASLMKFFDGGFITIFIAIICSFLMFIWVFGSLYRKKYVKKTKIDSYVDTLNELRKDTNYQKSAANIVYLSSENVNHYVEKAFMSSILNRTPKRADVYWFVNMKVVNKPYGVSFDTNTLNTNYIVMLNIEIGYKERPSVDVYLKHIAKILIENGVLDKQNRKYCSEIDENCCSGINKEIGDILYVLITEKIVNDFDIPFHERLVLKTKYLIKQFTASPEKWFEIKYCHLKKEDKVMEVPRKKGIYNISVNE